MAKKALKKGLFITFEGPEGCGKSTHSRLISSFLRKEGYDILYTREPGGTPLGDRIRDVLLNMKSIDIPPLSEMLLFEASRFALLEEVIRPALKEKKIVISDRFNSATLVYQGYAGGVDPRDIRKVEEVSIGKTRPDLTIILDIEAKKGLKKIRLRDRMESKALSFHKRVRKGYLLLAKKEKNIKVVKTEETIDATFRKVKKEVLDVIRRYQSSG